MLREIKVSEAFKAHEEGQLVQVLALGTEGGYQWIGIDELINGCTFFINEDEKPEPENGLADEEKEDTPAVPPKVKEGKRKQVDVGKIMALHRAGWSNVKIADEMDLHPITVGKYIKQEVDKDGSRED